ncbi:MAG: hypothetical protein PHC75_03125 [Burkholderiales bacterium]|nr:hypothetical protein [Burkholderiales bacterium]
MKIYRVGGYVRDTILGVRPSDCDYVVVGSNENEMLQLGYKKVGNHFPVFLHPNTHEEYALARKEYKNGINHTSFMINSDNVSLEEDLFRRDITINAIAEDDNGNFIDPYDGIKDIHAKIIRHISPAFMEDPLRILRVARFRAKLNFSIAVETYEYLKQMIKLPDVMTISKERIINELNKSLDTHHSSLFFITLKEINGLDKFFPSLSTQLLTNLDEFIINIDKLKSKTEKLLYLSEYCAENPQEIAIDTNTLKQIKLYHTINNIDLTANPNQILAQLKQLNIWRAYKIFQNVAKYNISIRKFLNKDCSIIFQLLLITEKITLSDTSLIINHSKPQQIKDKLQLHFETIIANELNNIK